MRIAYVALHLEKKILNGGVGRKITSQVQIWKESGHEVALFVLTPDEFDHPLAQVFQFQPSIQSSRPLRYASRELARSASLSSMLRAIKAYRPDVIFLRYGLFTYPLQRLFSIAPVVVELNTLDEREYRHRGLFFYTINRLTRGLILGRAAGLVPVSKEIGQANQKFNRPQKVISNGVFLESIQPLPAPENHLPVLVFVGTPGYPWHGVDKLLGFAARFPDLQVEVVGYSPQDVTKSVPPNVTLHGFLPSAGTREVLSRADVVFGTLAMHRQQMQEASPLKIREAMAYGIPVVLPFIDTDLSARNFKFVLQIANCEDNLVQDGEVVHEFAYRMRGVRVDREAVARLIDQREKEKERLAFLAQAAGTRRVKR